MDAKSAAITDSKASLNSLPDLGFSIYMLINCTIWVLLGLAVTQQVNILQSIYVFISDGFELEFSGSSEPELKIFRAESSRAWVF